MLKFVFPNKRSNHEGVKWLVNYLQNVQCILKIPMTRLTYLEQVDIEILSS